MEGGEWSNFNATVCVNEEADFMAQLFPNPNDVNLNYNRHHHHHRHHCHNNSSSHNYDIMANNNNNTNTKNNGEAYIISCDSTTNSQNLYRYSQVSSYSRSSDEVHYHNYFSDNHHDLAAAAANNSNNNDASSLAIDFLPCNMEVDHHHNNNNNGMHEDDESQMEPEPEPVGEDKISNCSHDSKKRHRTLEVQRKKKSVRVKRSQSSLSLGGDEEEEKDGNVVNGQSSSSGSLEDDCSSKGTMTTTTTTTTTALNSSGKTRASRGSATDPQSLYARKRRERINERLKILQGLVPNGTKVDISTMLEEAVQYVKFLQLQIKLLSSDELWMYAPIAYNGMNIGLDFKINLPR